MDGLKMTPADDRTAIYFVLKGLVDAGCRLTEVMEDTWCPEDLTAASSVEEAVNLVTGVDEAYVYLDTPDGMPAWIRFVLGNEPFEVVCDHTTNLSDLIDPITDPWM